MDYGETVTQCVVREAYEETGIEVEVERLVGHLLAVSSTTARTLSAQAVRDPQLSLPAGERGAM